MGSAGVVCGRHGEAPIVLGEKARDEGIVGLDITDARQRSTSRMRSSSLGSLGAAASAIRKIVQVA